jgi:exodeoxyribonuclease V
MIWSPQQVRALDKVSRWDKSRQPFFLLAGYAGTGKSTLAKHFSEGAGEVGYACFTGKAAHVLRSNGIPSATTIHSLIYTPRDKGHDHLEKLRRQYETALQSEFETLDEGEREKWRHEQARLGKAIAAEKENLKRPDFFLNTESPLYDLDLLIVDEYSMVDERMGRDLLSFGVPILALGDPGQLPPVQGRCFFTGDPDVMLTEIHRQARDNPIIRMSAEVREGRPLAPGEYGSSRVIRVRSVKPAELGDVVDGGDQVLVGTNATRRQYNAAIRKRRGYEAPYPERGEKVVCLRNNHLLGLLNGQTMEVLSSQRQKEFVKLHLVDDDGRKIHCHAHAEMFGGGEVDLGRQKLANEFDYGYALTVHKAQGSQWKDVVLVDEWRFKDRAKWLYTGITRAAGSITVLV